MQNTSVVDLNIYYNIFTYVFASEGVGVMFIILLLWVWSRRDSAQASVAMQGLKK